MPNPSFGLIAEGLTDHRVLKNILVGFFNDPDLIVRPLQPLLDSSDASQRHGGWTQVLAYCESSVFQGSFEQNDYLVIQLDTDRLNEQPFELRLKQSVDILVNQVIEKLELFMSKALGEDFLETYRERILFAISVNELECWLLPLYYTDKTAAASNNCLHKLNSQLGKNNQQTINSSAKNPKYYDKISQPFWKTKTLKTAANKNPSFDIFIKSLPSLEIFEPETLNPQ